MGVKRALHERSPPGLDIVPASQRRRLSFSNSDLSDPRQLQDLYERCLEQILRGWHPVSRDTAIRLAAIHCFVQFGPYRDGIQSSIRAYNLLPKEYVHAREHEKNIAEQYRNLVFPDDVAAQRKYCDICKNLPTYGMIFFEVKEPHGNKLIPRLFGVNKDCVMSVDKKTKVVRKSWPLEQLRRWAASPYTFNIDFGDYQDGYYSVQTNEGDKIKRLIAEFVDIILIKKQIVDPFGLEGDEGAIMIEDYVHRARSVPLLLSDIQRRMGSPRAAAVKEDGFPPPYEPHDEPRSPFVPLENQFPELFQEHEKPPLKPALVPVPLEQPFGSNGFPLISAPPMGTAAKPMPIVPHQPMPTIIRQQHRPPHQPPPPPAAAEHYDELPFHSQSPSPPTTVAQPMPYPRTVLPPLHQQPHIQQQLPPQQFIHAQVPIQSFLPPQQIQFSGTSASSPPPAPPPQTTQSLPPSLVSSIHQQQLTTTSSASISAFTSHDIAYEMYYKEGFAHRSFQQNYHSTRNLEALGTAIDHSVGRLKECRALLHSPIGPLALGEEEREQAIQLGEDTIRHRAVVFLACAAQAIEWTSAYQQPGPKWGHARVAVTQASDNLCELVQCVTELNSLVANPQFSGQTILLVNGLCEAFSGFLGKLHPEASEKRSNFLSSASLVGESAFVLLNALNNEEDALDDQQFYISLNEAIQSVANTTANLVLQAKSLPGMPGDSPNERVIQSATQVALYTSELIALSRVLAAIMAHPACQKRVQGAVERVRMAISELLENAKRQAFSQFALTGSTEGYAKMQRNALNAEMALAQLVQQLLA